ncbi:unnamed protein product [Orchesella dallaii]|uniref:RING-type domain-containing protein n=1 Tax=Orchesella dallaii TaxID=48710 RepID=A0ABP1Q0T8_9HEXA
MGSHAFPFVDEDLCCPVCRNPLSSPGSPPKHKVNKQKLGRGKGWAPHQQNNIKAYRNTRIAVGKFKDNEEISLAQCGHLFHKFCLRHYCFLFREDRPNNTSKVGCPICQASISMSSSHLLDYKAHQGRPSEFDKDYTKTEIMHEELSGQKETVTKKLKRIADSIDNGYHNLNIYRSHRHKLKQELRQVKSIKHEIEGLYGKVQYADRMLACMQTQHLKIVRKFINAAKHKTLENFVHLPRRLFPILSYIEQDDRLVRNLGEILVPIQVNNLKSDRRSLLKEILSVVNEKLASERKHADANSQPVQLIDIKKPQNNKGDVATNEHASSPVVVKVQKSSISILSSASLTQASIQKILSNVEGPIRVLKKAHKSEKQKKVKPTQKLSNSVVDNVSASDIKIIYMPKRKMIQQLSEPCRAIEESESSIATVPVRKCISTDAVLMKAHKKKTKGDAKSKRKLKLTNKRSNSITAISMDKNKQVAGNEFSSGDQVTLKGANLPLTEVGIHGKIELLQKNDIECETLSDADDQQCPSKLPKQAASILEMIYDNLEEERKSNHHIMKAIETGGKHQQITFDENQNELSENSQSLIANSMYEENIWQRPMFYRVDRKGVLRPESPSCVVFREPTFLCNSSRSSRTSNNEMIGSYQPDEENQLDTMSPEERYLIAKEQESLFPKNTIVIGGTRPMFHGIPACLGMPDNKNILRAQSDLHHTPFYLKKWQEQLPSRKVLTDAQRGIPTPIQTSRTISLKRNVIPHLATPALTRPKDVCQPMYKTPSIQLPPLSMFPAKRPSTAECGSVGNREEGPDSLKRFYNGVYD